MYYFHFKKVYEVKIVIRCNIYLNIQFRNPGYLNEEVNRSNLICRAIETIQKKNYNQNLTIKKRGCLTLKATSLYQLIF